MIKALFKDDIDVRAPDPPKGTRRVSREPVSAERTGGGTSGGSSSSRSKSDGSRSRSSSSMASIKSGTKRDADDFSDFAGDRKVGGQSLPKRSYTGSR